MDLIKDLRNTNIIQSIGKQIDIKLLLFIISVCSHIYSVKIVAIFTLSIFILLRKVNNKDRFPIYYRSNTTTWFYISLIIISLINLFIDFSKNYAIIVTIGIVFWGLNILLHKNIVYLVNSISYDKTINTLKTFVVLNLILSVIDLIKVMVSTGTLFPYSEIVPPPYGEMSGDFIKGLFIAEHLPNSIISTLLFFYFLLIKNYKIAILSLLTVLLASSNLSILIIFLFLVGTFILSQNKGKYYIILSFSFIVIFYIKINPINFSAIQKILKITKENTYVESQMKKVFEEDDERIRFTKLKTEWSENEENNQSIAIIEKNNLDSNDITSTSITAIAKENKNTETLTPDINTGISKKISEDTTQAHPKSPKDIARMLEQEKHERYTKKVKGNFFKIWNTRDSIRQINEKNKNSKFNDLIEFDIDKTPGLIISMQQTFELMKRDPKTLLFGNGTGNFSSLLAFMSSRQRAGSRLISNMLPEYEHPDFKKNHEAIFKLIIYKGIDYHSVQHFPYSTYNTLIGEYGLLGLLSFLFFYIFPKIGRALKNRQIYLILIIIPLFMVLLGTYYWFETFILIMFFEIIINNEFRKNATDDIK